jgi:hypothetical protein
MVTAWTAEATRYGVNVKNPQGQTVKVLRSPDLADPSQRHGVNIDEVDYLLDNAGYVMGTMRWQENGGYYKAVVTTKEAFARARPVRLPPAPTVESNMRAFGNPEGRRFTQAEMAARLEQVRATGNTRGWEKRLR